MKAEDLVRTFTSRWEFDARRFVREVFNATPDEWQDDTLELVSDPDTRRLAMKACKGPGKTAVLAWIIWWFMATRVCKIAATSITEANIDANLWPELYKWRARSAFLQEAFEWTKSTLERKGNPEWICFKRTWPRSGNSEEQANALAGFHADNVMFLLDESGGIPQGVMVAADAVLANEIAPGNRALVVQAGNPTHTTGPLHRACTIDRRLWRIVTITGDPDNPKRSPRMSLKWCREMIEQFGRDNPWVKVNVLGEFPPASINSLLGVEDVERAMRRSYKPHQYAHAQKRLGVDIARFGDDRTVIFPRQGVAAFPPIMMRQADTIAIAARVARAHTQWSERPGGVPLILIDDSGHWGHGTVDSLRVARYPVMPIIQEKPATSKRYKNVRTESWLKMCDNIKSSLALPNVPEMVPEFTEPTYTFMNGSFVLEPKDLLKKRLGFSPDYADALSNTYALEDMPAELLEQLMAEGHGATALNEFEPFEQRR